ncbi:MAG: hypothetical protein A2806_03645 [Candidatus Terrybacteria bacterium RIFCSPHIGHO2_01_FULL_48_17]|uniref:Phosphoribosyltransferase domain-containing protein n=1 Tax=Candidatus Terrybacteria bacterium RIFCSPHIGHO2_01_FULL_48_17 TaxID=1802362 RepID=A0A1G2PJ81_9BACT|nr:MAG: hypothetical protein A2806_03645 [Candidatus Terrybacteria bacterium RIFCSPHIGHO2_01_FULL_48_17]OHA53085.1 MAG: hypothetical protein A3A30_01815 [Candidatus Terrybacteria bacterium RIFCSPLOWO2_01_FULL_48_14]
MLKTLLFPAQCVGCMRELSGKILCDSCAGLLPKGFTPRCPRCSARLPHGTICQPCREILGFSRLFVAFPYAHPIVTALVNAFKFDAIREISSILAEYLVIPKIENMLIAPIPLHPKRLRERGFNQSLCLAEEIASRLETDYTEVLTRRKETKQQAKMSREQRYENLRNAFAINDRQAILGKSILLVDDVITTGATIREAAQTLRREGAKEIWASAAAQG